TSLNATSAVCRLTHKQVVSRSIRVREAFENWVDHGYIQHNPMAETGRAPAIEFLEPFFAKNSAASYTIKRIIADGDVAAVHAHGKSRSEDRGIAVVDIPR